MTSDDPNRDFAERSRKLMDDLIRESNELDYALRQGRVGDLIKKYNPRKDAEDDSDDDTGQSVEGEAGA